MKIRTILFLETMLIFYIAANVLMMMQRSEYDPYISALTTTSILSYLSSQLLNWPLICLNALLCPTALGTS